jgi:DNA-binding transcriptional regulator GbsR (MarR family)
MDGRRQYAEEMAVVLTSMGLPLAYGKLLGWLFVCDPPQQTGTDLTTALDLSKASVSTGMRMLVTTKLVRRVAVPGRRGHAYELLPDAFLRVSEMDNYRIFREILERGIDLVGGENDPAADRLRNTRDFYAFVEREFPKLIARFKRERSAREANADG